MQRLSSFTKKGKRDESNYRLISILSSILKIYERYKQEQLHDYFNDLLSKYYCDFRQDNGAQNCLLGMMEKVRIIRDKKGIFAAVLTDLSEAFDCIVHNLLTAKLNAYGFDVHFGLPKKQQTKNWDWISIDYLNILFGVPQKFNLGSILFIIFLTDLFSIYNDLDYASHTDSLHFQRELC